MSYYPYLLCGLPELGFDMNLENFSYEELHAQILELLQPADRKKLRLFLSFSSHTRLVEDYLKLEDEDAVADFLAADPSMPAYQKEFFTTPLPVLLGQEEETEVKLQGEPLEQALKLWLDKAFYAEVLKTGGFMKSWYDFDLVLRNTLVAFASRLQQRPAEGEFVYPATKGEDDDTPGEPEIITWIKENTAKEDFGLKLRLSYAEDLFAALALPDVYARERGVDKFRWQMVDALTDGKDFQMDMVMAFMVKARILQRWQGMDREKGLALLQQTVGQMRKVSFTD